MKQIVQLGAGGVNFDSPSVTLPENVFTSVRNVRFNNDAVETIKGEAVYRTLSGVSPDFGMSWRRPDGDFNVFLKDGKAIAVNSINDGLEFVMLSSANYSNSIWQSTYFNGGYAIVLNNGNSTPLYSLYGSSAYLTEIPGWNYITGLTVTAKVIKSLGYSLIAANLTLTTSGVTTYAPSTIRISTQAATGSFPDTWLPGLTTDTADEFEISTTSPILDMAELRNNMYVYTSDSIHVLNISSGITRVQPYSTSYGILNIDCVIEVDGKHIVVDNNDIYMHNGSGGIETIATFRIKNYFFSNLNKDASNKVFMKRNPYYNEVWLCYPKGTSTKCSEALIFNYKNNTWTVRDLPDIDYMFNSYDNSTTDNTAVLYMVDSTTEVLKADSGYLMRDANNDLNSFTSFVEREKLNSGDLLSTIHLVSMTPVLEDTTADIVSVQVVGSNNSNTAIDWSNTSGRDTTTLKPLLETNESYKVDPRTSGRLLSYRLSSTGYWRMPIIGIEVMQKDRR